MKVVVCDDEPMFRKAFCRMLEDQFAVNDWTYSCDTYSSGQELLCADLSNVQVVFLDIDMPGLNGLDVARQLRVKYANIIIIFVTAFPEYAVRGYCVEALRYLLKKNLSLELPDCLNAIKEKIISNELTIRVQAPGQMVNIRMQDILYFEGTDRRRVVLHRQSSVPMECMGQLGDYDERLKGQGFLRIQKSYLVNMYHLGSIRNYEARLSNGEILKVSERSYGKICREYALWKGRQL